VIRTVNCDFCWSKHVVRKGFRKNMVVIKQKYFCNDCEKWFVVDDGFKRMRSKPEHIVRALHEYSDGVSLKKVRDHLSQHDNVKVTKWAIRQWVVRYSKLLKKTKRDSALQRLKGLSTTMKNISVSKKHISVT